MKLHKSRGEIYKLLRSKKYWGATLATWMILANWQVGYAESTGEEQVASLDTPVANAVEVVKTPEDPYHRLSYQIGANYWHKKMNDKKSYAHYTRETQEDPLAPYKKGSNYITTYGATVLKRLEEPSTSFTKMGIITPRLREAEKVEVGEISLDVFVPSATTTEVSLPNVQDKTISIAKILEPTATDVAYQAVPEDVTGFAPESPHMPGARMPINGGLMSQLELTKGDFNLYFTGVWSYLYKFTGAEAANSNILAPEYALLTSGEGELEAEAFYRHGGKAETTIAKDVTINAVGNVPAGAQLNSVFYLGNNSSSGNPESKLINKGTVNLYGNKVVVANIDNVSSPGNITFVNEGTITAYNQSGSFSADHLGSEQIGNHIFGAFSYGDAGVDTIENGVNGKVTFYSPGSIGWVYTSSAEQGVKRSAINKGEMKFYGRQSLGVTTDRDTTPQQLIWAVIQLEKPIELYGDDSVGVNLKQEPLDETGQNIQNIYQSKFAVDIGKGTIDQKDYGNSEGGDAKKVENNVGINFDGDLLNLHTFSNYQITLGDSAKNSVAVQTGNSKTNLKEETAEKSIITLGGENNIALLSDGTPRQEEGNGGPVVTMMGASAAPVYQQIFIYDNKLNNILLQGKDNVLLAAKSGGRLEVVNTLVPHSDSTGEGATLAYAQDSISSVVLKQGVKGELSGTGALPFYTKSDGYISIEGAPLAMPVETANHTIRQEDLPADKLVLSGSKTIGFYSHEGSIDAQNMYLQLKDGTVGAYSKGANSSLNINHSILDFSGAGFAVYAEDGGKVDLTDSVLVLRGHSVAFDEAQLANINVTGLKIVPMSNDAIIVKASDKGTVKLSTIDQDLGIGDIDVIKGEENGTVYTNYKKAFVDGIDNFTIDENIDKTVAVTDETSSSYKFIRNYLIKKAVVNVADGIEVKSHLTTAEAKEIGEGAVLGLTMSSSDTATTNAETQINLLANTTVSADRLDAGNGAIGLLINYGKVNVADSAKILVEMDESSAPNARAVGIYAVNGSEVANAGTITARGEESIGILGMSYRLDEAGNPVVNEFDLGTNQGVVAVVNEGNITMEGNTSRGIVIKNNNASADRTTHTAENSGTITLTGDDAVGMAVETATGFNKGTISGAGAGNIGMVSLKNAISTNEAEGAIDLTGTSDTKVSIGMVGVGSDAEIINKGTITGSNKTYGMYGNKISLKDSGSIALGNDSVGIYALGLTNNSFVTDSSSSIQVGENSTGIYVDGDASKTIVNNASLQLGDRSFGYFVEGKNTTLTSNTPSVTLGALSTFMHSEDPLGTITNHTKVSATGKENIGIYSVGKATNLGDMDFSASTGSIGLFAGENGYVTNGNTSVMPTIQVGKSDKAAGLYSVGMVATGNGTVENFGTINVTHDDTIGMYASGAGAKAINRGTINIDGQSAVGMYLDNAATGLNYGTIQTVANSTKDGMAGVYSSNGSVFKNYGKIIVNGDHVGVYLSKNGTYENAGGTITAQNGAIDVLEDGKVDSSKKLGSVEIKAPSGSNVAKVFIDGKEIPVVDIDTIIPLPTADKVSIDKAIEEISKYIALDTPSKGQATSLGMYVDTSGINYTKPIEGLEHLSNLKQIDLVFGTEASKYTKSKAIDVGNNILAPYNEMIAKLLETNAGKKTFSLSSSSLTWIVASTFDSDGKLDKVYLVKIPYSDFATEKDTHTFLSGLEEKYGNASSNREQEIFNKLNSIGKGESGLFVQSIDEMKGHQYANTARRITSSNAMYDKEFKALLDWTPESDDAMKVKVFGEREEYRTATLGLKDYNKDAHGVFVMNTKKKDPNSTREEGWFAGFAKEEFSFKDIAGSKERTTSGQFGYYAKDVLKNHSDVNLLVKTGLDISDRQMDRKFFVVDEVFGAKANYSSVGVFADISLEKERKVSDNLSFTVGVGTDLGVNRISTIHEKTGDMRLNAPIQYAYTARPHVTAGLDYTKELSSGRLKAGLDVDFGYDFGRRWTEPFRMYVAGTSASNYELIRDREAVNVDVLGHVAYEATNYSVDLRAGYDVKNEGMVYGAEARFKF